MRYALTVFNKGGAGLYEELAKQSPLPSISQLQNYKRFTSDGPGWHPAAVETCAKLVAAAGADTRGGLAFDEMKISKGLVFSIANNAFVGWADLDAGSEARRLEHLLTDETLDVDFDVSSVCRSLATHVLHFSFTSLGEKPTRLV